MSAAATKRQHHVPVFGVRLFLLLLCLIEIGTIGGGVFADKWEINGYVSCSERSSDPKKYWRYLEGVKVQFWDADTIDPDDLLGEARTDKRGHFKVVGEESETFGNTEPYLLLEHNCTDPRKPLKNAKCTYVTRIQLPVQPPKQSLQIAIGDMEYAGRYSGEEFEELKMTTKVQNCD